MKTIEIYREPNFSGHGWQRIVRSGEKASPMAFPDLVVDVADLFKLEK